MNLLTTNNRLTPAFFASKTGGQFATEFGGQFERNMHQPTLTAQYAIVRAIPIDVLPNGVVVHTEDLKIKGCAININTHDIMYITTFNKRKHNYLILRLYGKQHHCLIIRGTLDKIMESLPANMFYSCLLYTSDAADE